MAIQLKHYRSGIAAAVPTPAQLDVGQIAMNYQDEYLFIKNAAGEVIVIASSKAVERANNAVVSVNTKTGDAAGNVVITPADIGANGVVPINGSGKIDQQYLPESLVGAVVYQGTWDASTNTPTLADPTTVKGWYYVVTTAGTQFGNDYGVGDWAISNGVQWQKVDALDAVTSVAGKTGAVVLAAGDIASGIFATARLGATPANDTVLTTDSTGAPTWVAKSTISGVTSVGMNVPAALLAVSPATVTSTGTFDVTLPARAMNLVFAGPASGANAAPTFRALVVNDIPSLDATKITTGTFGAARLGATPGNNLVLTTDGTGAPTWVAQTAVGQPGTVTSVAATVPSTLLAVTGSPITAAGTLAFTTPARSANVVYAGPSTGADAAPAFRQLVQDDIPSLDEGTF